MTIIEIHRRVSTDRVKHGQSTDDYELSHILTAVVSYRDSDAVDNPDRVRNGRVVHASAWVANGSDVTYSDLVRLPDNLYYRIQGKPLIRQSGLTGTAARTRVDLIRFEG